MWQQHPHAVCGQGQIPFPRQGGGIQRLCSMRRAFECHCGRIVCSCGLCGTGLGLASEAGPKVGAAREADPAPFVSHSLFSFCFSSKSIALNPVKASDYKLGVDASGWHSVMSAGSWLPAKAVNRRSGGFVGRVLSRVPVYNSDPPWGWNGGWAEPPPPPQSKLQFGGDVCGDATTIGYGVPPDESRRGPAFTTCPTQILSSCGKKYLAFVASFCCADTCVPFA